MTPRADRPEPAGPRDLAPVHLTDPRAIRALAHPARLAVIDELYAGRELTATECAEVAGLSPSAMSYHLRSLEKAGIVERAPATGDGRERPWRAAGSYLEVDAQGAGAGMIAASNTLSASVMGRTIEQFDAWLGRRSREPREWQEHAGASYAQVWLRPEEAEDVQQRMLAIVNEYRGRRSGPRPEGARRVRVAMLVFPSDEPKPGPAAP
jgi:DNA-binding transcriptional ArsR family regulator